MKPLLRLCGMVCISLLCPQRIFLIAGNTQSGMPPSELTEPEARKVLSDSPWASGSFATPQGTPPVTGNLGLTLVYVPGTAGGITEINSANNVTFATAPWAHGSNGGIAITPDGSRVYVDNAEDSSVSVFDTAATVPLMEIAVGQNPNPGKCRSLSLERRAMSMQVKSEATQ